MPVFAISQRHSVFSYMHDYMIEVCEYNIFNQLSEFHQIYNLDALGDKDELIKFCGQKVKAQGHTARPHTGHFLTCLL